MYRPSQFISALMTIIMGVLLCILKNDIIGILLTVLGVILIVIAVFDIIRGFIALGVIKAVMGAAVLALGWWLVEVAMLIVGIILLVYGAVDIIGLIVSIVKGGRRSPLSVVLGFIAPVLCCAAGIILITSVGALFEVLFIIAGVLLIVDGVFAMVSAIAK